MADSPYTVSDKALSDIASRVVPFTVCVDGRPVIVRRSNGQHFYMQYREAAGAQRAMLRVVPFLPRAEVVVTDG